MLELKSIYVCQWQKACFLLIMFVKFETGD